jgi:hypothetical protein
MNLPENTITVEDYSVFAITNIGLSQRAFLAALGKSNIFVKATGRLHLMEDGNDLCGYLEMISLVNIALQQKKVV